MLVSCSSPEKVIIDESSDSLSDIKKAVVAIIGEPRLISENQREFFGPYHGNNKLQRAYYHILILGARRPYQLEIKYVIEKKYENKFIFSSFDRTKAAKAADDIKNRLNESRDNANVIDDFRAF